MSTFGMTHPATAWLAQAAPTWLAIAAVLALAMLARGRLLAAIALLIERRQCAGVADAALLYVPQVADPGELLAAALLAALVTILGVSLLAPLFLALALSGPVAALLLWGLVLWLRGRYRRRLDAALPAAVGRLAAQLRAGSAFQPALERVTADLPPGPLAAEWGFVLARLGTPLAGGMLASPARVVGALAAQTPSLRHSRLLAHLEVALGQSHDVQVRRLQAAHTALYAAEQRRSAALTELAQMRYSGVAVGLAGILMVAYLLLSQAERVMRAYTGPLGMLVALLVVLALVAPIGGGMLLAALDDLDD